GLRPLVQQAHATESTAKISRAHAIETTPSGLVSILGGKWTNYRRMALQQVDVALRVHGLEATGISQTHSLPLVGAENYDPEQVQRLHKKLQWPEEQCRYLSRAYGSRMEQVVELARSGHGALLCEGHPHLEAEVLYAARNEMACTSL